MNLVESNLDLARALLLVAIFVALMTGLQIAKGLSADFVTPPVEPTVNTTQISAVSALQR